MLEESKQLYIQCANLIPNWKKLSKNDLANLYLSEINKDKKNSYLSAIVCKFWNLVDNFYYRQGIKVATELDCQDWVIDGILKALEECAWKKEDSSLFNDPKGPEKAITVCIYSIRANFYQYASYDKRSLNYNSISLEGIEENASDGFFIPFIDKKNDLDDYIVDLIKKSFEKKDYFLCFFYDLLFGLDIITQNEDDKKDFISLNKLIRFLNRVDKNYLLYFSNNYDIDINKVEKSFSYIRYMPRYKIRYNMDRSIRNLKNDETIKDLLRNV